LRSIDEDFWFYVKGNNVYGGYKNEDMRYLLQEGCIDADTQVAHDPFRLWQPLSNYFANLNAAFGGQGRGIHFEEEVEKKATIVKMALSEAMKYNSHGRQFHVIAQKLTRLRWYGARALTHFLLNEVLTNEYEIDDKNHLTRIVWMCFSSLTKRGYNGRTLSCCSRWLEKWLSINHDTVRGTYLQIITYAVNEYVVCLENYLRYGVRAHYVNIL